MWSKHVLLQRAKRQHEERGSVSLCFIEWPWNKLSFNGLLECLYTGNVDINELYVFDWFQLEDFLLVSNLKVAGICRHCLLFLKFRHKIPVP